MARGRARKAGLTRMDAAIDALTPLGFSKKLISSTVKALLKVYDDDSGWVFIEEASYKLLIDTILEEQETDAATKGDGQEVLDAAESSAVVELHSIDHKEGDIACYDSETVPELGGASDTVPELGEVTPDHASGTVPAVLGDNLNEVMGDEPYEEIGGTDYNKVLSLTEQRKFSWKDISCLEHEKRKPCYGWISSEFSEDDEDDILTLDSDGEPVYPVKVVNGGHRSRWDVKPGDL
ncbi:hypothetical protein Sjap_014066 [Stephania japonica]|uniref:WIYLD domain-containing protein n=1 Tax=Stephania japonica TaxID=461633 RepID=A0AAP0NZM1_9MAGN